ncbi:MAG TPA: hypothetical protein VG890_07360 [Puia sp.]|nr:hypothetical protein [Puia sp.]
MSSSNPVLAFLIGLGLTTLLDSLGAILSNKLNIRYTLLIPFCVAIYIFTGFLLGRHNSYLTTCLFSGLLGLFDSTIGLRLSIHFKANMGMSKEKLSQLESLGTSIYMIIFGWLFGSLGFAVAVNF